ncbi:MAG: transporter substrate-binding domain-containing protein [Alphaproteobacteria bacterium]|nr:transporter substrate-binding domain-containing protein [Alphaproteobacteria bacterium]
MLSRREFGGGLTAVAAVRRRGTERPPPPPPANEPNLARVLRTKKLRVGGLLGDEPYFYRNPTGRWSGFLVAMASDLAAALGVELAVAETNWAEMVTDLHTGKFDLTYGPSPTAQRAMFADYAAPLFHDTYAMLARKGFAPKSWAEINVPESLVAVDSGSAREEVVQRIAGNTAITGFKTRDEALQAVQSGRADCFVSTVFFALAALNKNPHIGELVVPTPQWRVAVCPAMPYDDDRRFRGVVDAWTEDNRGTGQIQKWILAGLATFGINEGDLPPGLAL